MFCVFVSIQFRDKIVLIIVYESLNGQYPFIRCDSLTVILYPSIDFID